MKEKIEELCKKIEKENNIKILFAIENGSRAWRMESKDSDYDIRFVYARPIKEYLQINQPNDVINISLDKDLKPCKAEGALIDISGFDIFKYTKLLANSNPTTIEWITTDIIYYGEQNKVFKEYALKNFNPMALYYHYKSLCKNNYLDYIKSRQEITYKKYLYSFRGLINAKYVAHKNKVPPIIFIEAVNEMKGIIPEGIIKKLYDIIKIKSEGREKNKVDNIGLMDSYIESFLKDDSEIKIDKKEKNLEVLNKEIQRILKV